MTKLVFFQTTFPLTSIFLNSGDIPAERSLNAEEESEVDENDEANELEEREDANEEKVSTSLLRSLIKRKNYDVFMSRILQKRDETEMRCTMLQREMLNPTFFLLVFPILHCTHHQ